jgi:DNA ligase-1
MFKPALAAREDPKSYTNYFKELRFPLYCSPKLDGIRCLISNDPAAMSRSWKQIPSFQVQEDFTWVPFLDGELIAGNATDADVYNRTQSFVMSKNKPGDLSYHVFDYCHPHWLEFPFEMRLAKAQELIDKRQWPDTKDYHFVEHVLINNIEELLEYEGKCLDAGYEGIIMRDPKGRYKCGRSTWKEGLVLKLKRFADDEAEIVGFVERKHNTNTQTRDALGYAERSSSKEGMVGTGMLGKFLGIYEGEVIEIAPGCLNHDQLKDIWMNKEQYIGKLIKFRHFPHGVKDKPRFPRFVGFRDKIDL